MSTHIEGHPATVGFKVSRLARLVAVGAVLFAFCAAVGVTAYSAGQASRPTDAAVAAQRRAAAHLAVVEAVRAKGAADHLKRLRIVARHVAAQRAADQRLLAAAVLREQRAGDRRAALAFARGRGQRGISHRPASRARR